jgi:DNA modification methylase
MTPAAPDILVFPQPIIAQADATALPLADASVDLVFTSPPYVDARTYGIGAQRDCVEWIDWMKGGEISQAIPPAYTEFIGKQFLAHVVAQTAVVT